MNLRRMSVVVQCPKCGGSGFMQYLDDEAGDGSLIERPCLFCKWTGRVEMVRTEDIIRNLDKIRSGL